MTARLLVNENFPRPSIAILRDSKVDLVAIAEIRTGMSDSEVLDLAVREQRWVITFDRDYGDLVYNRKRPAPPAIVLLRVTRYQPTDPAGWVAHMLSMAGRIEGQFVVYELDGIRMRPLLKQV